MKRVACLLVGCSLCTGCTSESPDTAAVPAKTGFKNVLEPPPPPPAPPPPPGAARDVRNEPTTPAITGDRVDRVRAQVGVGKKGRSLDNEKGMPMLVVPARTLFRTRERLVFEVQIPQALSLYEATNGRGPKSHEQFMKEVIKPNHIQLPELPAGQRYVYDAQTKQLMVEKPAR